MVEKLRKFPKHTGGKIDFVDSEFGIAYRGLHRETKTAMWAACETRGWILSGDLKGVDVHVNAGGYTASGVSETDPEVAIHAEVVAWHDEHALFGAEPLGELRGSDRERVPDVADGAGRRRHEGEHSGPGLQPVAQGRQILPDDTASAPKHLCADLRGQHGRCHS